MGNECEEDQVKPIHFFKIILTHCLLEGKLMIPRTFVEKYGECSPKSAFLKAPNGGEWKVNLVKDDGKIWFQNGWKEFAEYHSLAEGHIVVFRYETMPNFQVFIFDMGALEIDYPIKRVEGKRASDDEGNKPAMVVSLEDYRPSQKRKDTSSLEFLQQIKKRTKCVVVESILQLSKATMNHTGKKCNKEGQHTTAKNITALDRARAFKSCNPFCLVFMHPSYIESKANLNLPSMFGNTYFDLGIKRRDINLQLENGRVWPARYLIRESYMGKKFEISRGWKPFAMDNNLKVGDVCIFELIDGTKLTFHVYIFRKTDNSKCSTSQEIDYPFKRVEGKMAFNDQGNKPQMVESVKDYRPSQKRKDKSSLEFLQQFKKKSTCVEVESISNLTKATLHHTSKKWKEGPDTTAKQITALDRASSLKPYNPSFLVVLRPSHVHFHFQAKLNLPSKFCKTFFDLGIKRGDINLQLKNGRVWPAKYLIRKIYTRTIVEISTGWKQFSKDNNLEVGDVCNFELIDRTKLTFQIYIFREVDNSNCPTSQESAAESSDHGIPIQVYGRKEAK